MCIGSYRSPSTIGTNIVPFTLEQNNFMVKHSQYEFKPPYNTMQATRLLHHNNPPQNQSQL